MTNKQYVIKIDKIASKIIKDGGNEDALLVGLVEHSDDFYRIMKTSTETELNMYCEKFPGFNAYARTLENLAIRLSEERVRQQNSKRNDKSSGTDSGDSKVESMIELHDLMTKTLFQMRDLVNLAGNNPEELVPEIKLFLLSVVSTAADLVETAMPGGGAYIYEEIAAGAKIGGMRNIAKNVQDTHHAVSGVDEDDISTAMNHIGKQLINTLTKAMNELPLELRNQETQLRGVETLLVNLLSQKFDHPHYVLDSLCDHVHMGLDQLSTRENSRKLH